MGNRVDKFVKTNGCFNGTFSENYLGYQLQNVLLTINELKANNDINTNEDRTYIFSVLQ
jgi:hypothetical protein